MSSKPTLRDIAEATGVSTASVSMILNGKSLERFSSQRVASVLAEAERIGYRTPSARCAGKQIAILSPSVSNPYHTMMISGIDAAASAAGYQTAIYNTYWNPRTESHLLDTLDYSRVAGIIFAMTPIQTAKVRELSRRVPIVAVGDRVADCGIDTVDVDNFGAAQLVAKHLIDPHAPRRRAAGGLPPLVSGGQRDHLLARQPPRGGDHHARPRVSLGDGAGLQMPAQRQDHRHRRHQ